MFIYFHDREKPRTGAFEVRGWMPTRWALRLEGVRAELEHWSWWLSTASVEPTWGAADRAARVAHRSANHLHHGNSKTSFNDDAVGLPHWAMRAGMVT